MDCLTLDIGGTKTAAAWWRGGELLLRREAATHGNAQSVLELVGRLALDAPPAQQVGAAITGVTDGRTVWALNRHLIEGWDGLALADRLEQRLGLPASLLNDAQAAAWGEYRMQGDALQDLMFITVSTGIGAGLVLGGKLRIGATGLAGHLGHTVAGTAPGSRDAVCSCGRGVCLECQVSGAAMRQTLAAQGLGSRSARSWMQAEHRDVPAVQSWLRFATDRLANAIADAHALLDLQGVLLGGGLGMHPVFLRGVQTAMAGLPARYQIPVVPARLGADAGLRGMALWLQERGQVAAGT